MSWLEIDGAATTARLDIIAGGGLRALGECARRSGEIDAQVREMRGRHEGWKKAMDDLVKTDQSTSSPAADAVTPALGVEALRDDKPTTRPAPPTFPPAPTNPPARLADTRSPDPTGRPSTRGRAQETGQPGALPGFGPRMRSRVDRLRQAEAMRRGTAQPGPAAANQPDGTGRATHSGPNTGSTPESIAGLGGGRLARPAGRATSGGSTAESASGSGTGRSARSPGRATSGGSGAESASGSGAGRSARSPGRATPAGSGAESASGSGAGRSARSADRATPANEPTSESSAGSRVGPRGGRIAGRVAGRTTSGRAARRAAGRSTPAEPATGSAAESTSGRAAPDQGGKPARTLKLGAPEDREFAEPKSSTPLPRRTPGKAAMPRPPRTADGDEDLSGRTWLR